MGTIILAAALYLALSPRVAQRLYHPLLFQPQRNRGDLQSFLQLRDQTPRWSEYRFQNRVGSILRAISLGDLSNPLVVMYVMGKDGDIEARTEQIGLLLSCGVSVYIFEYSGYGKSDGKPSIERVQADAQDAWHHLVHILEVDASRVVLFGESFGGAIALSVAATSQVRAIVLKSAFSSMAAAAREKSPLFWLWPAALFPRLDNVRRLSELQKPTFVVHGTLDSMFSLRHAQKLFEAAAGWKRLLLLPNSRHAFTPPEDQELLAGELRRFFGSLLPQEEPAKELCDLV